MSSYESPEVRAAASARAAKRHPIEPAGDTVRPVRILQYDLAGQTAEIEKLLRDADDITICGIAGPALIAALKNFAVAVAATRTSLPWGRLRYITPEPSLTLATRGELGLGPVVRSWQSALEAVRDCIRLDLRTGQPIGPGGADQVELYATPMMYQETIFRVVKDGRSEIWAAVGPHLTLPSVELIEGTVSGKSDAAYLVLHNEHPLYKNLDSLVERFVGTAKPYPLRQVTCPRIGNVELQRLMAFDASAQSDMVDGLAVEGLRWSGTTKGFPRACLPIAAIVVRSMTARGPVVVLRLRKPGLNSDAFGRLALLTSRIYEEDLASALGVSLFFDREAEAALEEMWRATDVDGPLSVSLSSFVRAAQREIYTSLGLDMPPTRFRLCGFQALEHESGDQNCFAVFELILDSRRELQIAMVDADRFQSVRESELFTSKYTGKLNHLLEQRQDWLQTSVLSRPIHRSR